MITSDLQRARLTSEALMIVRPDLKGPVVERCLREQNFGELEGLKRAVVAPNASNPFWLFPRDFRPRGGESFDDVVERAGVFLISLQKKQERDIVLVTHGNFMRAAIASVLRLHDEAPQQISIAHWGCIRLSFENSYWTVHF